MAAGVWDPQCSCGSTCSGLKLLDVTFGGSGIMVFHLLFRFELGVGRVLLVIP
jgi:hypothetical protein